MVGGVTMSKMNIDEAFEVVCKRLDDYDTFLQMVRLMREAQKYEDEVRMALIENAVDRWLEENRYEKRNG